MNEKSIVFSGIQPTGVIHIGNYLGAIKNWISLQETHDSCFFSVVDLHSITITYNTSEFSTTVLNTAKIILACGVNPLKSTFFIQSHVAYHTRLMWLLSTVTPYGDLTRMTQFKDKSLQHTQNINAGLFIYPILMAADILLYKATHVPVGQDQLQHLELVREISYRFNERYNKDIFIAPKEILSKTGKLKGLDGEQKMSKSLNNYIGLTDSYEEIQKKLKSAKTDPERITRTDKGNPFVCNIFTMHQEFSSGEEQKEIIQGCTTASIGCVDCKQKLLTNLFTFLEPIQEKMAYYNHHEDDVIQILAEGKNKANLVAKKNYEEIAELMGFLKS